LLGHPFRDVDCKLSNYAIPPLLKTCLEEPHERHRPRHPLQRAGRSRHGYRHRSHQAVARSIPALCVTFTPSIHLPFVGGLCPRIRRRGKAPRYEPYGPSRRQDHCSAISLTHGSISSAFIVYHYLVLAQNTGAKTPRQAWYPKETRRVSEPGTPGSESHPPMHRVLPGKRHPRHKEAPQGRRPPSGSHERVPEHSVR